MSVPVWMYVVQSPPTERWNLLRAWHFSPAKRSGNWYRFYDNRLSGTVEQRLHVEAEAERLGMMVKIKPVRRSWRPRRNNLPAANTWHRQSDKHLGAG